MRMTVTNNRSSNLNNAKRAKNDEFYTRLEAIENELKHYKHHFKDKVVYCNCDDPNISNFFKYFALNFDHLGLKKLITSCYRNTDPDLRSKGVSEEAVWLEYEGGYNNLEDIQKHTTVNTFKGDGDFRSEESIELLKEADIVVTNPPFSLFREYVAQLVEYDKQFLILGNNNAVTYKEIFPLIKDNKMWLGYSSNKTMEFELSPSYEKWDRIDENGNKIGKVPAISWFTNMDIDKRYEDIILYRTYNADDYPKYDNYDAINVDKVSDIPVDYDDVMGVPITFLTKHNPEQFEIVGSDFEIKDGLHDNLINESWDGKLDRGYINGKRKYSRIMVRYK